MSSRFANGSKLLLCVGVAIALPGAAHAIEDATVERADAGLVVTWSAPDSVDVYVADGPDADPADARLVSEDDADGRHEFDGAGGERVYFLLHDDRDQQWTMVAERALPLAQGSNFRDLGGYETKEGKHVRWGKIYRSAASPLLSEADEAKIASLGLVSMVDLRSSEERVLAPTRIEAIPYSAIGYSLSAMAPSLGGERPALDGTNIESVMGLAYRGFPEKLAPHLRLLFAQLLRQQAPLAVNCTGGQDRTGFATAMILSALGVPRETIYRDYHLSTVYRQPEFELPVIDPEQHPDNPVAQFYASIQKSDHGEKPMRLFDEQDRPYLWHAFDEIERRWGSVDGYLSEQVGLTREDIAALRAAYVE